MRAHLAKLWETVWASYWFVPTLMALGAIALALLATASDRWIGEQWIRRIPSLSLNTPAGARDLLSTIAGSMITVAGVTFSITIAAVAYAAGQLGPRLLGNFMRDTSNQVSLGTFIATFVYCLLVLRTIHGAGEGDLDTEAFVPHIAIVGALVLALASLGVLIYFFHHVPTSIQANEVIAQLGYELESKLITLYPSHVGEEPPADAEPVDTATFAEGGVPVRSLETGYLTHLDGDGLVGLAQKHDLVLRLLRRPGNFVSEGEIVALVFGKERTDDELLSRVAYAFATDRKRTPAQDVPFIVQQLVEIAARSLSPAMNDVFTAIGCLDWLGSALIRLGNRTMPSTCRFDAAGQLRVVTPTLDFAEIAAALDQLRPYVSRDRNAALHAMTVIERVLGRVEVPRNRAILLEQADALLAGAAGALEQQRDRAQLAAIHRRLTAPAG